MICCRCSRVILDGEPFEEHVHDRASAGPLVLHSHRLGHCPG